MRLALFALSMLLGAPRDLWAQEVGDERLSPARLESSTEKHPVPRALLRGSPAAHATARRAASDGCPVNGNSTTLGRRIPVRKAHDPLWDGTLGGAFAGAVVVSALYGVGGDQDGEDAGRLSVAYGALLGGIIGFMADAAFAGGGEP